MFYHEHRPPHFHVRYGEHEAVIRIADLVITEGRLPPRVLGFVVEWAARHHDELLQNWEAIENRRPLRKIEPLDGAKPNMHWTVVSAKYVDGYRLAVTFADGTSGVVDLAQHIRAGGVFARLGDVAAFKQFTINAEFGTICWGDDLDIAPETLYYEVAGVPSAAMLHEAPPGYGRKQ
jgi:hypothetical protein